MFATILACLIVGCVSFPSNPPSKGECGSPLPTNYEEIVEKSLKDLLIDPESARFEFEVVRIGWKAVKSKPVGCYIIKVWVNAKNRMGGYSGKQPYWFAIRDGAIIGIATPEIIPQSDFNLPMPMWWN